MGDREIRVEMTWPRVGAVFSGQNVVGHVGWSQRRAKLLFAQAEGSGWLSGDDLRVIASALDAPENHDRALRGDG